MRGVTLIAWAVVAIGIVYLLSKDAESATAKPHRHRHHHSHPEYDYIEIVEAKQRMAAHDPSEADTFNTYLNPPTENHTRKKRSMAIGRTGWRPGKRASPEQRWLWLPSDHGELVEEPSQPNRGQQEEVPSHHPQRKEYPPGPIYWPNVMKKRSYPVIDFDFDFAHPTCDFKELSHVHTDTGMNAVLDSFIKTVTKSNKGFH